MLPHYVDFNIRVIYLLTSNQTKVYIYIVNSSLVLIRYIEHASRQEVKQSSSSN